MLPPHLTYAQDIVSGEIVACESVIQQCQLSLLDHEDAPSGWYFDQAQVDAVLSFVRACPHVKGAWANRRELIEPLPWMEYAIGEIYGWWSEDGTGRRRYNHSYIQVGKKNGKSTISATLCLYETYFGDQGAEVISAATKLDQAKIAWNDAMKMVPKMPELAGMGKIAGGGIHCFGTDSVYYAIGRDYGTLDGHNPSFVLLDEAAAIKDRGIVETLSNSFGARESGHMMRITTAQGHDNTIWLEDRTRLLAMLKEQERGSREFALFYEPDKDDDTLDETVWIKANPGLGKMKSVSFMQDQKRKVASSPALRNDFDLHQMNRYTGTTEEQWLDTYLWDNLPDMRQDISQPLNREAIPRISRVCAIDMSVSQDLTAFCSRYEIVPYGMAFLEFKCYATELALERIPRNVRDDIERLYRDAEERGECVIFPGSTIDYDRIEADLRAEYDRFPWKMLGYDPYLNETPFINLDKSSIPVARTPNTMANLTTPTGTCEAMIRDQRYKICHSPFIRWQFQNSGRYENKTDQVKVRHFTNQAWRKNDAIIAMLMAERVFDGNSSYVGEAQFAIADWE